jgi:exopolyphosphatase/guanosine-5'-triphosphate,3'-diphosphate pyrophosphatase
VTRVPPEAHPRGLGEPRPAPTAAVIDVGSNSVLLLVVTVDATGRARGREAALVTTRLGSGLREGGRLQAAARARTRAAVVELAARARAAGAAPVWAFATAAVRRAADGPAFARALAAAAGVAVEVLAADDEARLAYDAVAHTLGEAAQALLVVDVGGGTTELTLGRGEQIVTATSLPLGALVLTEARLGTDPPTAAEIAAAVRAVDEALASSDLPARARAAGARIAVSGGTATALAALNLGLAAYDARRVHGHVLGRDTLGALIGRLVAASAAARAQWGALDAGRAAVLPAGALILERVAAAAGAEAVIVSDHGVRHAYLARRLAALGITAELRALWT